MYCKVQGCRFSNTHVTSFHQCGRCKMFGHGIMECNDYTKIEALDKYINDKIADTHKCTKLICTKNDTHTTTGHCCRYCGSRNENVYHMKQCPNNPKNNRTIITDPLSIAYDPRPAGEKINLCSGTYSYFNAGMGCVWYVRNNNNVLEYFFLHSDSYGQYGDDSSDIPLLNGFVDGYKNVFIEEHFSKLCNI
jgi:hypothetical protein